jgi:hypothetical protein
MSCRQMGGARKSALMQLPAEPHIQCGTSGGLGEQISTTFQLIQSCRQISNNFLAFCTIASSHCYSEMDSSKNENDTFVPFTKAERIKQFNDIDKVRLVFLHCISL